MIKVYSIQTHSDQSYLTWENVDGDIIVGVHNMTVNAKSQDDLLSGIDLSMLTPDEIDALNKINNDLYQDLPRGLWQAAGKPSTANECTCDTRDLLTGGCRCGAFKREKAKEQK